jgi:TIR domain
VYMDDDFPYGCPITKSLSEAVSCSRKFVAVMSPDYTSSRLGELEYAEKLMRIIEKEAPWNSLLIVKYKVCAIPKDLIPVNCVDYAANTETFMARLIDHLGKPTVVAIDGNESLSTPGI